MATYNTYDAVGIKEDISDIITNISPTDTPFMSSIGSDKVHNTLFQWQEDALAAVAANAQVEGADAVAATLTPTTMRNNYTQILEKVIQVSGTNDAISAYGRAKESAYQMAKKSKEIKRDLEYGFVGTGQTAVAGSDSVARQFAGVQAQIDASQVVHTGGTSTAMSEANLLLALENLWKAGVDPTTVQCSGDDSQIIAAFAAAAGRYRTFSNNTDPKKIVNAVDLYVSPYGTVRIALNRWLRAGDTLVYNPEYWQKVTLRNWFREVLAKTGDSLKQMIVGEFSLKHKNYFASSVIRRIV